MASEDVFRERMNDPKKRRAAYDAMVGSGYNMRPFDEFEANLGYGEQTPPAASASTSEPTSTTTPTTPTSTTAASPAPQPTQEQTEQPQARTSQAKEPAWQPTTQERIRMMEGARTAVQPFSQSVQGRTDAVRRNVERHTAEGLQRQRLAEARAEAAGLDTRLTGLGGVPGRWDAGSYGNNENDGSGAAPDLAQTASPVVYDTTVDEQGRTQIVWLMPDGTLTSDRGVAEQGAARARQNRLMSQFVDRMRANGLDPAKQADIQKQAQLDYEEPMRRAVDIAWNKAEDADKAANDAYDKEVQEHGMTWRDAISSLDMSGMRMTAPSRGERMADMHRRVSHKKAFSLAKMTEDALANMPEYYRKEMLDAYTQHFKGDRKKAEAAFRDEISQMLYERLVERTMPKGTAEFVARKIADGNLVSPEWAAELTASAMADSYDENIARNAAMAQYGKEHRVADIAGTVLGMAADPVTYVSGGVGGAAGKAAMSTVARTMAARSLKGAATGVAKRVAGSTLGGRLAAGMVGGGANFGAYEALKNIQEQVYTGGVADYSTGKRGGYSLGAVLGAAGRGVVLGAAMGSIAPVTGNVADRIVSKVGSTAGKAGVRAAQGVTNVVAEGTVFAMPEWISGNADFMDAWTDGMATALGFKVSHAIKSVPRTIEALRPKKDARGRVTDGMDFEQRLHERLNGVGKGMALTKEDERELRDNGYGGLADLFGGEHVKTNGKVYIVRGKDGTWNMVVRDGEGVKELPEGTTTKEERTSAPYAGNVEMDGYDAMRQLMGDGRVSEAARAKCYWILTGRQLPMSTVAGWQTEEHGDGTYTVRSVTAGGDVITSRRFKNKRDAQGEEMKIRRQAEYNTVEVGERYAMDKANKDEIDDVYLSVANKYGTTVEVVKSLEARVERWQKMTDAERQEALKKNPYAAPSKGELEMLGDLSAELFANQKTGSRDYQRPDAIRTELNKRFGVDIDKALSKEPSKRTSAEQDAINEYLTSLFPKGTKGLGNGETPSDPNRPTGPDDPNADDKQGALAIYEESKPLYEEALAGDPHSQAEIDAIALRMEEAEQLCDEAFGEQAEYWMYIVHNDPWSLINDPALTPDQQEAVLYYINAKAAMDGVIDASNDVADRKRVEAETLVSRRTHQETKNLVPALMKVDDRQVYIVKGNVVMFPDGTGVDARNSDSSVVVCDAETGDYEFTSPDQIYKVDSPIDPQVELNAVYANIQAEQESILGNATMEEAEQAPEEVNANDTEGAPIASGEASENVESVQNPTENVQSDAENVPETPVSVQNEPRTALSRVPVGEDGEPDFTAVDRETALDALTEVVGGNVTNVSDIVMAQVQNAGATLEALKKKPPTKKAPKLKGSPMAMAKAQHEAEEQYATDMQTYQQQMQEAQRQLDAWNGISGLIVSRNAEARAQREAEQAQRRAEEHDAAQARFEEEQRIRAEKAAEQEAVGTHAVNPKIKAKWDGSTKVEGHPNIITLPDGSTIRGRYVLTEAGAASASHDANNGFTPTEGFPIDENGQSVNDRDYQRDTDAQRIVESIANQYDNRALQTPVIVSKDGVVLSGNNRTMSGDMAAHNGTDKAYVDYLREFGQMYGFTPEQVDAMQHPRVVFVPDEELPYYATTFARFNAQEMKSQSKPEAAVKLGKVVPDEVFNAIVHEIGAYDRLSQYYANEKAAARALGMLMQAGVINDKQLPEMRTGTALSAAGKELIENTLIGKVFQASPDAVRQIISTPSMRESIVLALTEVADNRTLSNSGYDLAMELGKAVDLVSRAKTAMPDIYTTGIPVSPFGRMQGLFDDEFGDSRVTDGTTLLLADLLNSKNSSDLRKVLAQYNNNAHSSASGQMDIFSGEVMSKEQILTDILNYFRNATPREQQALVESAINSRKERAEQARTEQQSRGGSEAGNETADVIQRSAEPQQQPAIAVEERPEPTQAQLEAGNYKKEHRRIDGHKISIENVKGSVRRGVGADGKPWETVMQNDYGYIRGTIGPDDDHIDVFLSDTPEQGDVFVIDQVKPDGSFDEHKVMYGFPDMETARKAYLSNYEEGWQGLGTITQVSKDEFKKWIESSTRKKKPFVDYASVKPIAGESAPKSPTVAPTTEQKPTATEPEEETASYTITPTTYTNKKNKTSDVHLVTFNRELTKEERTALDALCREPLEEGRKTSKGWYDRKQGGYMMRSEEAAKELADMIADKSGDAVADRQPLGVQELRDVVGTPSETFKREPKKPANRVTAKDITEEPAKTEEPKHEISDDEMKSLADELRDLLGIGEDEGDADINFRDPGELTHAERQKIQSAGIRLAMGLIERGSTAFPEYADKMVRLLGDKIRPWLKSFYEGARWVPGYEGYAFTPSQEVATFDVENFDKTQANPIRQASMMVEERKVQPVATQAAKELTEIRNLNRRKENEQRAADTEAIASKAETLASQAESLAETAKDERELNEINDRLDEALDEVNDQLALLGYYEADEVEKDFNEAYGFQRNAEKKAVQDATRLAKQLVDDLGIDLKVTSSITNISRKSKKDTDTVVRANVAPAGGEVHITLPLQEGRELVMYIYLDPADRAEKKRRDREFYDDLEVSGIMYRIENPEAQGSDRYGSNNSLRAETTYGDMLNAIRRSARQYLPGAAEAKAEIEARKKIIHGKEFVDDGTATPQDYEDAVKRGETISLFGLSEAIERERGEKGGRKNNAPISQESGKKSVTSSKKKVKPEQPIGDLFGGLFDEPINDEQKTDVQPRSGSTERAGGHQPQQNEPLGESQRTETERPDRRGVGGRDSEHPLHDGERSGSVPRPRKVAEKLERLPEGERKNARNNRVERGTDSAPTGVDARIKANIEAIELAKQLLASGEEATPEQMAVLRRFSGWGGLGKAFNDTLSTRKLYDLLGAQGFEQANMSRNSAYFTPAHIIDSMWDIARTMGFKGGNVLEGSAGIGNVLGLMPADLSERSSIHAVEIDGTTGGMLSLLYPDAKVEVQGFEATKIPNNSVDLAITNVPFVPGLKVNDTTGDKDLSKKFRDIHDFCIAKNIRKLREGGIGIFITTRGTLDTSAKLRAWITNEGNADVVGAFRLNNQTFGETGATSDIIVVRKRVNGKPSPNAINVADVTGIRVADYDTGETRKVKGVETPIIKRLSMDFNKYYVEHPECMGGEMRFGYEMGDTYRPASKALYPVPGKNQPEMLKEWASRFSEMTDEAEATTAPTAEEEATRINERLGEGVKEGSMVIDSQGNLCVARMGDAVPLGLNKNKVKGHTKAECFRAYTAIKKALSDVLEYQSKNEDNAGLEPLLKALNRTFDNFVKTYGNLHKNTAISFLRNDVDFSSILALETYSEKGDKKGNKVVKVGKTDIFSRRVIEKEKEPQPTTIKDGILASLYKSGSVDVDYISQALSKSVEDVKREIVESGLGFENPSTGAMEVSYQYLSGNVREKLHIAEANNEGGRYDANIKALQSALPMTIPAHLIEFTLGSSWLEPKLYEDFIEEKTGIKVTLTNVGGTWYMKTPWSTSHEKNRSMGVISKLCNRTVYGHELLEAAITNKSITVSKIEKHWDGSTETITDKEATQACATKVDELRQEFKDWARAKMQEDAAMSERIEQTYNEVLNNYVPMEIPADFVPQHFGGQVTELHGRPFALRPHQSKTVIRATTQPVLLAHEVGTGKTYTLITTAMEMRRLGTARKPMIVVQNATVGQFVESAKEIYPNAKVLTIEEADRTAEGRRNFYAKIKYNDWDMIVIPQSVFERIPDSEERQMAYINDIITEKLQVLEIMREQDSQGNSQILRQAKRDIANLQEELGNLSEAMGAKRKRDEKKEAVTRQNAAVRAQEMLDRDVDDVENFDDMGIDAILVDEAHEYKHLGFATAMQRGVKGVDPSPSKKSQGVYLKTQAVLERNNGRNVVFATGTPISNTAAEIWTFMRYLMPADRMKEYGIYYFDDFVRNFGNISQMMEFKTNGKFAEVNRFAGYVNLPELVRIWSGVADTVLTREAGGVSDKIPDMEGGKAQDIFLPQTKALRSIMKHVNKELEKYDKMSGKEKKENSHIPLVMYGIAKAAAVDARLVLDNAEDDPNSKTNATVRETLRSLKDSEKYRGTVAIFCDNYQNKRSGFNVYDDIKEKLIEQGVPEEQIVIMRSGMTVKKKLEIFDKVNAGEVRVIMGSTYTLGTGVNVQERLHLAVHIDAPNRPMDYTQRNGRILRQGNLHKDMGIPVRIIRFGVEDSLDVTAYQRLKTKGAIADSIMNGSKLMKNSMENRVMEEDEDVFGDMTAQLSGSEYAILKNQAEREVRSLTAKQKQHEADQIYIHNRLPELRNFIAGAEWRIKTETENLAKIKEHFPEGKVTSIEIGKLKFSSVEEMADFFTDHNKRITEMTERVEKGEGEVTSILNIIVNGMEFVVTTKVNRKVGAYGQGTLAFENERKVYYDCPALGIKEYSPKGQRLKNVMEDIAEEIATGRRSENLLAGGKRQLERNTEELGLIEGRYGAEFPHAQELADAKARLSEYEAAMKKEMEAKEAKYAEIDATVEEASDLSLTDEASEEEEAKFRDRDEEGLRVFHGSGADFEAFDHSHMGEGEGAQEYGWGTYVTSIEDIGRGYATKIVTNNSTNLSSITRQHNAERFLKKYPTFEAFKAYINETRPDKSDIARNYYNQKVDDAKGQRHPYTVEIPTDNGKNYFNWDGRIGNVGVERIGQALERYGLKRVHENSTSVYYAFEEGAPRERILRLSGKMYGDDIHRALSTFLKQVDPATERNRFKSQPIISQILSDAGFVGIKYPADFKNWNRKGNAQNYVIFKEGDARIVDHERFRMVQEGKLLDALNAEDTQEGFRFAQMVTDTAIPGVRPPMSGKVDGEWRPPMIFGEWEQSEEGMKNANGKADLVQGNGRTTGNVAYNPYFHIRVHPLNDQFSAAFNRPELIIVRGDYPKSELTSGYRAEGAKNSVGMTDWHAGSVNGQLPEGKKVQTMLSRYFRGKEIMPWSEAADRIMSLAEGENLTFPINVFPPMLRAELSKRGAKFQGWSGTVSKNDIPRLQEIERQLAEGNHYYDTENCMTDTDIAEYNAKIRREIADRRNTDPEAMAQRAEDISKELGVPVRIIRTREEADTLESPRQKRMKGMYLPSADRKGKTAVTVVIPNHANVADVENTVVHEIVGHKGLRALVGEENFDRFLDEVHDHASDRIKAEIDARAEKMYQARVDSHREKLRKAHEEAGEDANAAYYSDMAEAHTEANKSREKFRRDATEEYMSDMAGEIGNEGFKRMAADELTLWGKIKARVLKWLDRIINGLHLSKSVRFTDKDIAYILFRSWKKMHGDGGVFDAAEEAVMRHASGFNANEETLRFRWFGKKKSVNLQHENGRPAQNQSGEHRRTEGSADGRGVDADAARRLGTVSDRSDIRVFEEGHSAHREQHLDDSSRYRREAEGERLIAIAKANGLFIPREKIKAFGERISKQSRESEVYINFGENRVYKVKNPYAMADSWCKSHMEAEDAIYEHLLHNKYFPETAYKFEGIAEGVDGVRIVLSQPLIKSRRTATDEEVKAFLEAKGLHSEPPYFYTNDEIWVSDFNGDNALIGEDGQIYLIDPVIDVRKPVKDIIGDGEPGTGEVKFRDDDADMGLEETITRIKAKAMQANTDNLQAKRDAMRAIGGNLNHLRQAMARQREYDLTTVKSVTDLAKVLMEANLLDDLSKFEVKRILGAVNNVLGKQDVSNYVQKVMDIMVDNQLRLGANALGKLLTIKGSKVDARGIEVQGELDPQGAAIAKVIKKTMNLPKADIEARIFEAVNRMGNPDTAIADEAAIEYAGLQLAHQYCEEIAESKAEEKALRDSIKQAKEDKDAGQMTDDAYRQYVDATNDAIRQNKIERAEAYHTIVEHVGEVMGESIERAKAWREAEKARVAEIQHNANSDMQGRPTDEHHKSDRVQKFVNNGPMRFLFAPLATFDQMLRMFGRKSVRGEGYLWNRYMRGWVDAAEQEYTKYQDALKVLDEKVSEVFGKKMKWGDLFTLERKLPKASVRFFDGGEFKDHELTQGNLLYIYMADKMADGRMKLRRMGITEDDVENIKNFLDPRFIQLADWMQEEFLVDKRNEYNEVHKRMFGASMASIENYFPLKILANARLEEVDVAEDANVDTALPATSTGSIIKRRRNNLALDVVGADAFSVILDHLQQMERWAAFAEYNRDLNTLLSYKRFRNQVMNMSSVYGGGKTLWTNFRNVCSMAAGAYRPPVAPLDKAAVNIAKGVTAAKVSFRVFTALKQLLSFPAYFSDSNPMYLAANVVNPVGAWNWSLKNLPLFEKRWKSRIAGDPRLMKSELDWKAWRSNVVQIASRIGMSPNAFVDALTVAMGAHAMYQTKKAKYLRYGYTEEVAEKRAKQDATILFNQTQQSSEAPFVATMQVDRSWLSVLFTIFRNASISYTRQLYDAMRNIGHRLTSGYKGLTEEFMTKQMIRDGIDPDKADRNAKQEYRRGIIRDVARIAVFGYVLQLAWNLGAYLPYILLGDDDDEKQKMWDDVWNHTMFGSIEGLTGGDVMSATGETWLNGEGNWTMLTKDMPLASDLQTILRKLGKDNVAAMNDVINLLVQSGIGVNPQSLTDAVVAVMDYCGDDAQTSRECALLITRVLNCPQSQIDKIYFDELDASAAEASQMSPQEIAERYARYKVRRGAPLTGWAYSDSTRQEIMQKYRDRSNTLAKERLERATSASASSHGWQDEYKAMSERLKEIRKKKESDEDAYYDEMDALELTPEYDRYLIIKDYKRDIDALTKEWLRSCAPEQRDSCARAMIELKSSMMNELREAQ